MFRRENANAPIRCPHCGLRNAVRNGVRKNGSRKYVCRNPECGKSFDEWTGTIFSSCKLPSAKIRLLLRMVVTDCLLEQICECVGISSRTAYVWRMKIYSIASDYVGRMRKLSGTVWIDEKFVPVNRSKRELREDGKGYRGISRNQLCICCGVDGNNGRFAEIAGTGHPRGATCKSIYGKHIRRGSFIVHDEYNGHGDFIEANGGKHAVYPGYDPRSLKPMQPINSFCAQIERKFVVHVGMLNEHAQLYLDWCVFETVLDCMDIEERIAFIIRLNIIRNSNFRVKDRYNV